MRKVCGHKATERQRTSITASEVPWAWVSLWGTAFTEGRSYGFNQEVSLVIL